MSQIKPKQIFSSGSTDGQVLTTDGTGKNTWSQVTGDKAILGTPDDGLLTDARYVGGKVPAVGLTPSTKIVTAIDSINEILGLLLPNAPANLSTGTLALATPNTTQRATQGYTTNGITGAPAAGANVLRTTAATADTNVLQDLGDGASGTIAAYKDGASVDTFTFSDTPGDSKTAGLLRISDNKWGGTDNGGNPAPAGFFQSFDSQIAGAPAAVGLNTVQLRHSVSGNTNILAFVRDDLTAVPAVSAVTVEQGSKPASNKSSGIEHYATGDTLVLDATATNLAGQTYLNGTILSLSGPGSTVNFAPGQAGLPAILAKDTLSFDMTDQTFTVGGNIFSKSQKVTVTANNPNGSGNAQSTGNLLVLSGTQTLRDATITGPAVTNRVYLGDAATGDTPAAATLAGKTLGTTALWDKNQDLSADGFKHEAAVVGGSISADRTDYSTGYLPVGINYSSKDAAQYVTYRFNLAAKSSVAVTITGTYAGMWVALPGVTGSPEALGGVWWSGQALYSGAGVPGKSGDAAAGAASGTVATGTSGTTSLTFGTQSSSNSTNNAVFIRVKLIAGQSITAISVA
jgi:hypothetical protein